MNLNRIFLETFVNTNPILSSDMFSKVQYELSRLPTVANAIAWSDFMIDLHSTSSDTPPFAVCASGKSFEDYACSFPVEYVIKDLSKLIGGTTVDWASTQKSTAVSIECGQHFNPHSVVVAKNCIMRFVKGDDQVENISPHVVSCNNRQLVNHGFHFLQRISAFQTVQYNELIGEDINGEIRCPFREGAVIIMPTEIPILGEEAWFWGIIENSPQSLQSSVPTLPTLYKIRVS